MLLVNLLMVNHKCFSLDDLLHRLHCMVWVNISYAISANKLGWMERWDTPTDETKKWVKMWIILMMH